MIYVNGRFLTQEVTGVQRFAIQILLNLIKIRDDIVVLCPKTTPDNEITKAFNIKRIEPIRTVMGANRVISLYGAKWKCAFKFL